MSKSKARRPQSVPGASSRPPAAGGSVAAGSFAAAAAAALAAHRRGDLADAVSLYQRAHDLSADADIAHNLGAALRDLKRVAEAAAWFRRCIAAKPGHALAHANLGLCLYDLSDDAAAIAAFDAALALRPDLVDASLGRSAARRRAGDAAGAIADLEAVLARAPGHVAATLELARIRAEARQHAAALALYDAALARAPEEPRLLGHKGTLLFDLNRLDEAEALLRRAHAAAPREVAWPANLGLVLLARHRHQEALDLLDRALALDPANPKLHVNRAAACKGLGLSMPAIESLDRALALQPVYANARNNLGNALREQGRIEEAVAAFRAAVEADPAYLEARSNLVYTLNSLDTMEPAAIAAEHRRFGDVLMAAAPAPAPHGNDRDPARRLRIGYVSPDFVAHSVAYFVEALLEHHDRRAVEIVCYATGKLVDGLTPRLKARADLWRDMALASDAEFDARIREDRIDILIDLAGHTAHNRLALFARRPAPVQATWIGYPNTTGLRAIDYRIVDAVTDPPGEADRWAAETLIRLPRGFLCYRPSDFAPDPAPRPAASGAAVTFGSFNALAKMNDRVVATWARILHAVPGSRLMLKQKAFADPGLLTLYRDWFARHGIGAERLELLGRTPLVGDHLAVYGRLDIALDPFPYNGTTTTCEALCQGVPVVTLLGAHHVARVGASLLGQVGLEALIARNLDAYVEIAVALARDPARIAALSAGLRPAMARSALLDPKGFTAEIEAAFRMMWRRWCAGLPAGAEAPAAGDVVAPGVAPGVAPELAGGAVALVPAAPPDPARAELAAAIADGAAALEAGRVEAAQALFEAATRRFPDSPHAALNLGTVHRRRGDLAAARAEIERAIALAPGWAPPHANLGGVLVDLGAAEAGEAACRRALALDPGNRIAHANLASAHAARQRDDLAIAALETALSLGAPDAVILKNLAATCTRAGRLAEAAAHGEAAIRVAPGLAEAHANLASIYAKQGRRAEARAATREAVRLKPDLRVAWSNMLLDLSYADDLDAAALTAEHRAWGETQAGLAGVPALRDPDPGRRLRVGFVSADFCAHSVAFFLKPLFDALDPAVVEIVCYSDVLAPDVYTGFLQARAALWRNCAGQSDAAVAEMVAADGIDILVDLAGHTAQNRLGVFARRRAPVQVTWLGYPATTGLPAIDHRIVDAITDPPGAEALSVERLARLPGCFLCYEPPATSVQPGPLPAPVRGRVTFGSFNNVSKINGATVALWAGVLAAVPGARLLLKSRTTRDEATRARLLTLFEARGIAPARIDFLPWQPDLKRHIEIYRQVDIALDTVPYNGTTTTCEAHWMGVPVVTLAGDRHAARVGASLSHALGLGHLVATDAAQFTAIAARLASDLPALAAFRAGARDRMRASPLLDGPGLARRFEAFLRAAWAERCAVEVRDVAAREVVLLPAHVEIVLPGPGTPVLLAPGDARDDATAEALSLGAEMDAERAVLSRMLGPGSRVADLAPGAGDRTLMAAALAGAGGAVHAVAATPEAAALLSASAARNGFAHLHVATGPEAARADAVRGADLLVISGAAAPVAGAIDRAGPPIVLVSGAEAAGTAVAWDAALAAADRIPCRLLPSLGMLAPASVLPPRGVTTRQDGPVFGCAPAAMAELARRGLLVPAPLPPPPTAVALDRAALMVRLPFASVLARRWTSATLPPALEAALSDWLAAGDTAVSPGLRLARLLRAARLLEEADAASGAAPVFAIVLSRARLAHDLGRRDMAWALLRRFLDNKVPVTVDLPFLPPAPRLDTLPIGTAFAPWYRVAIYETAARCVAGWQGEPARLGEALCAAAVEAGLAAEDTQRRAGLYRSRRGEAG